jgi:hypothetical protein
MATLRDHLQSIYDQHQTLTPRLVVDLARKPSHPLHSRFEWDDSIAGERYRESQARDLIQSVKIRFTRRNKQEADVRHFVSVRREDGYSYMPIEDVAHDEITTQIVLRDMEREWRQLQAKYGHMKEFIQLVRKSIEAA